MAGTLASDSPTTAAAPVRRRRWLRRFVLATLLLAVGLAGLGWFAPAIVCRTSLREMAIRNAVAGQIDGSVTVDSISASWLEPVELRGVHIRDAAGNPVADIESISTSKPLHELARNQADLGTITITRPAVTLLCEPAGSNLERVLAPLLTGPGTPGKPRPAVEVRVVDCSVTVRDSEHGGESKFENVTATATVPAAEAEPIRVAVKATNASGNVDATLALAANSSASLRADKLSLASVAPLIRRFGAGAALSGTLTATVTATWGTDATGQTEASADGRAELSNLDLTASWLGTDRLRFEKLVLPAKAKLSGNLLRVEQADLTCDAGSAKSSGVIDLASPMTSALSRPGQNLEARVNLAKLAAILPQLLRIREGTAIESGDVSVALSTTADGWSGRVDTTRLHGTREGLKIAWENPLHAEFAGRLGADGLPIFDKLICQADFVGLAAKGSVDHFQAKANLNLDRLSAHLGEFVDVNGLSLTGKGEVDLDASPRGDGTTAWSGTANFQRFMIRRGKTQGGEDPTIGVKFDAITSRGKAGEVRVETASAVTTAATDQLRLKLSNPIPDARTAKTIAATANLTGDLMRWRWRVNALLPFPRDWYIAGAGTISTEVNLSADAWKFEKFSADTTNTKFFGLGLRIDEREIKATGSAIISPTTGAIAMTEVRVSAETIGAYAKSIEMTPAPKGEYTIKGSAAITADVARTQKTVGLLTDTPTRGTAKGTVTFDINTDGHAGFDGDLTVEKLGIGPAGKPIWSEPTAKIRAVGQYDPTTDSLTFKTTRIERDGLAATAKGSLAKVSSPVMAVKIEGNLDYDLAKIEPQLRTYLGAGAAITGKDSRPFQITGTLGEPASNLSAKVDPAKKPGHYDNLTGSAAVAWKSIRAYGFEVGPAELRADLAKSQVKLSPIDASFGGGKVKLAPTVELKPETMLLTFAPGNVVEKAKLTPSACANALGYVLPLIANVGQADGTISFALAESRVPLEDPEKALVKGTLTVHTAAVSAGPFASEIITLLGVKSTSVTLASNQAIPVRVEKGRVYHENFVLHAGDFTVRTSGSVGLDGSLSMVLDIPVPASVAQQLFPKNPRIRDALAKQSVKVPVGGTLAKPQLDAKAFRNATGKLIEDATKQAAKDALGNLFK